MNPQVIAGLRRASILVELHDFIIPGISKELASRFSRSHWVEEICQTDRDAREYPFRSLYLRLLPQRYLRWAVSEWRPSRMTWFWMQPREVGRTS
jgi:hypothetical protein